MGWPLPLTAIQILWINVVTETIPAAALSFEKENGGVMKQAPRRRGTKILQGKYTINVQALINEDIFKESITLQIEK